ncbi:succinate dehydrogenase, cytochrome b556 subunit [Aestuariispira insulae]|uniref:Succinate dehydrogenase cytochrome b556 subunit n=1 Tax=Aestuariispira insulae TaxID=1461337 RepID=A0A3D9HXQ1_9PROT|nr:succinate dehydrogenase, cytochrome b556 subunit [Aestuariispira insulae]RED54283.1 succinate dehydrogenase subunit C [Aestuariispira insulae]
MSAKNRPLSPHLQVYRWQWTMAYSILHRATGVALSVGALFLVCWLVALAGGAAEFTLVQDFSASIIGKIMLLGWTWSLFYHLANGIRHMVWDSGRWLELKPAELSGHISLASSVVLTLLVWVLAYSS